jgi:hypothetical protein
MNAKKRKELEDKRQEFIKSIEDYNKMILRSEGAIMLINEILEEK